MGGDSLCLCPCCSVLSSTTGQHVCRCYHTSNLQPLSAAPGARERLIYGASQAWGVFICVCCDAGTTCGCLHSGGLQAQLSAAISGPGERLVYDSLQPVRGVVLVRRRGVFFPGLFLLS